MDVSETHIKTEDDSADENSLDKSLSITGPKKIKKWQEPESDAEDVEQFDTDGAWRDLFLLPSCQQIMIETPAQKLLEMVVGVNVSQQFPWKQIRLKYLRQHLFHTLDRGPAINEMFRNYDNENHILLGYAPLLTQNQDDPPPGDPFIFFVNTDDMKLALVIIRNIESYERWSLNNRLIKRPQRWYSFGSENEVNLTLEKQDVEPVEVEIQSIYPLTIPAKKAFSFRKCADVRDGYVELLPSEHEKFENIIKKRISVGIQSAPYRVNLEQQTDPTFPTNAWAQYLYEIDEKDDGLDLTSEDEEEKARTSRRPTPVPVEKPKEKAVPELSDQIKLLLKTLDFNQIDMYRNDYPLISTKQIEHFTNPYLEETLCFANISKSYLRYVSGIDWYPSISGLIITSYTFSTAATIQSVSKKIDVVQREVLQPNPILMWSFSDNLNYKLEFESPTEIIQLSFCPHDHNILFGGSKIGQLILWDLQNRAQRLEIEEILTAAQTKYRALIGEFLDWTIQINEDIIVPPATSTSLEQSQKAAITGIYWYGEHFYITAFGKTYKNADLSIKHKYFVTCSFDGSIKFWNLDALTEKKGQGQTYRKEMPKALTQSESDFKNKVLKPVFSIQYNEPITAIVTSTTVFRSIPNVPFKKRRHLLNFGMKVLPTDPNDIEQTVVISTFYGRIERLNWLGVYSDTDGVEYINISVNYARVHDGPILSMKKNPFWPKIFISIGRHVFAVWYHDYNYSPILWRKCISDLTAVSWSEDRPGVFFLTRIDGNLEAWDLLARDDNASFNDILGGGIITAISEHRPADPEKLLGIGDYNSSFRMVKLPKSFYIPVTGEKQIIKNYVLKEISRKKSIQAWEHQYNEIYIEIIEAKREAEIQARQEIERLERESLMNAMRKAKEAEEALKNQEEPTHLSYTERMKRQWDELNLRRLMSILMTRKRVDEKQLQRETALEKKHLAYEASKKDALLVILQRVSEEVAAIRSRILPVVKPDLSRSDMIMSLVTNLMERTYTYKEVEEEANEVIDGFAEFDTIDYLEFLERGGQRRGILDKTLGGNTERLFWYEYMKTENLLGECNWSYEYFTGIEQDDDLTSKLSSEKEYSEIATVTSETFGAENDF